jgi:hypothetical protein
MAESIPRRMSVPPGFTGNAPGGPSRRLRSEETPQQTDRPPDRRDPSLRTDALRPADHHSAPRSPRQSHQTTAGGTAFSIDCILLCTKRRANLAGKEASPTAAIVDSQSVTQCQRISQPCSVLRGGRSFGTAATDSPCSRHRAHR